MGKIRLVGDYSSKIYTFAEESSSVLKIRDASDNIDYLTIDNTTITDATGVKLASHASRHQAGGTDQINLQALFAMGSPAYIRLIDTTSGGAERRIVSSGGHAQILDGAGNLVMDLEAHGARHNRGGADPFDYSLIAKLLLKSVSPTLGTGGTLGSAVSITPDSGYVRIVPLGMSINVGGTIASGETITVQITFVFDNNTSTNVSKSFTATGTTYLTDADFFALWNDGVGITSINVQAGSSATSTSATVTVTVRGVQH